MKNRIAISSEKLKEAALYSQHLLNNAQAVFLCICMASRSLAMHDSIKFQ